MNIGLGEQLLIKIFFENLKGNRILRYGCQPFDTFLGFSDFFLCISRNYVIEKSMNAIYVFLSKKIFSKDLTYIF